MQRSFGAFDVEKTAIFKAKTGMSLCPYSDMQMASVQLDQDSTEIYYFERGEHRLDTPVLGDEDACGGWFYQEIIKEQSDMMKAYLDFDKNCGEAMVGTGR